jgi:hypothetical protein
VKVFRERRISRELAVVLVIVLTFWILAGLDRDLTRPPNSNRFQYPAAVFVLLVLGEALRGVRIPSLAVLAFAAVAAVATISSIGLLNRERGGWEVDGFETRAVLAGVELAGDAARPDHFIAAERVDATVKRYREAAGRFGSPAYDEEQVLAQAEAVGSTVDREMAAAVGAHLAGADPGAPAGARRCRRFSEAADGGTTTEGGHPVHSERIALTNLGRRQVEVELGRFAPRPAAVVGVLRAGETRTLRLPLGVSPRPWRVGFAEGGRVELCEPGRR